MNRDSIGLDINDRLHRDFLAEVIVERGGDNGRSADVAGQAWYVA